MRYRVLIAAMMAAPLATANAQEFWVSQGKGVNHWPNNDNTQIMTRFSEMERYGVKFYTEAGLGLATVVSSAYGRAFNSFQLGRQVEYTNGPFFANASLGLSLVSRTADGPEYAIAPYASFFAGARYRGVSAAIGQWTYYKPNLHSQYAFDENGPDARYPTAVFTGLRFGIDLDVKRGKDLF